MPKNNEKSVINEVIKGGLSGVAALVFITLIVCGILLKTNLSSNLYLPLLMITAALSGVVSGFSAVRKRRENGLINGLTASIIPAIIMLIAMSAAYKGFSFFELIIAVCCLFGGAVGGIAAVNIKKKRKMIKKR